MRGALTDATLPVVIRRTCVYPSHLLAAAVKCLVMLDDGPQPETCEKISGYTGPGPVREIILVARGRDFASSAITLCCYSKNPKQQKEENARLRRVNYIVTPSLLMKRNRWREPKNFLTRIRKLQPIFQSSGAQPFTLHAPRPVSLCIFETRVLVDIK